MNKRWLLTIPALFLIGAVAEAKMEPIPAEPLQPAERIVPACPSTVWTGWNEVPACDMDGSQTWVLTAEASETYSEKEARKVCQRAGGVFALEPQDPATHYCIDVDY
jgi:hypothetical protein